MNAHEPLLALLAFSLAPLAVLTRRDQNPAHPLHPRGAPHPLRIDSTPARPRRTPHVMDFPSGQGSVDHDEDTTTKGAWVPQRLSPTGDGGTLLRGAAATDAISPSSEEDVKSAIVPQDLTGDTLSSKRRDSRSRWMFAVAASSLLVVGTAREARALPLPGRALSCSVCNGKWGFPTSDSILPVIVVAEVLSLGGGLVTGIGSTVTVARRGYSYAWFFTSYVFSGLNLTAMAIWGAVAQGERDSSTPIAFALTHGTVAAWGLTMPTIGLARGPEPRIAPVALGGRDAGGRLWSGVGVQVVGF